MSEMHEPPNSATPVICPACGFEIERESGELPNACPACGSSLSAPPASDAQAPLAEGDSFIVNDDTPDELTDEEAEERARQEHELEEARRAEQISGLRISQVAALRRGAYKSRSYAVVMMITVLIGVAQFILLAVRHRHDRGSHWATIVGILCTIACLWLARFFSRRITELNREIAEPAITDPAAPPDFSTLSDGSQRMRGLELIAEQAHVTEDPASALEAAHE